MSQLTNLCGNALTIGIKTLKPNMKHIVPELSEAMSAYIIDQVEKLGVDCPSVSQSIIQHRFTDRKRLLSHYLIFKPTLIVIYRLFFIYK